MRIALINESSQAAKNKLIFDSLKEIAEPLGHEVFNCGMNETDPDYSINYIDAGLLAAILLNTHAVDFVITGCGTGEGACMALNMFPNVYCGYVKEPSDAYLFSQINAGNAISLPFAKDFGWCAEVNLKFVFKELFSCVHGKGYPQERGEVQKEFRDYFYQVKQMVSDDLLVILHRMDREMVQRVTSGRNFRLVFEKYVQSKNISEFIHQLTEE